MSLRSRRVLVGVVMAAVVAGIAWVVTAQATNTIYACVTTRTGQLRIVSAGTPCTAKESPLQWNVTGPQGPQGEPGPKGDPQPRTFTEVGRRWTSLSLPSAPGCTNYLSVTVTAPVAGRIILTAYPLVGVNTGSAYVGLATDATTCVFYVGAGNYVGAPGAYLTLYDVYDVAAGTYTFYLNGNADAGTSASLVNAGIFATFTPN